MSQNDDKKVSFEMEPSDLAAISEAKSKIVPNVQFFGKTAFTIENAPVPKTINDAIGVTKTVTVQMKVKLDRDEG